MGLILSAFLVLIVGLSLTPTVANAVSDNTDNLTGSAAVLFGLIPLFWVMLILSIVAVIGVAQYKRLT